MPQDGKPGSGFAEYMAALQSRRLKQAFAPLIDAISIGKLFAGAQDAYWRQAAAELRAEDEKKPTALSPPPARGAPPVPERNQVASVPPTTPRRGRRGRKTTLIDDSSKMNEQAIREAEQLFRQGKSVDQVMDELGFSDDGNPNQKYRKKLRRLERSLEEPSP